MWQPGRGWDHRAPWATAPAAGRPRPDARTPIPTRPRPLPRPRRACAGSGGWCTDPSWPSRGRSSSLRGFGSGSLAPVEALLHAPERLGEGPFKICDVVRLTVVVRDAVRRIPDGMMADPLQSAFDHGLHCPRVRSVELRPLIVTAGHVHRRRMGEDPALPRPVMAGPAPVTRPATSGREPAVAIDRHFSLQVEPPGTSRSSVDATTRPLRT